jgi:hypothetical protein
MKILKYNDKNKNEMSSEVSREEMNKILTSLKSYKELNSDTNNIFNSKYTLGFTQYDSKKNIAKKIYTFIKDYYDIRNKLDDDLQFVFRQTMENLFMEYLTKCKPGFVKEDIKSLLDTFLTNILYNAEYTSKFVSEAKYLYTLLRLICSLDYKYETNYVKSYVKRQKEISTYYSIKDKYLLVITETYSNMIIFKLREEIKMKDEELDKLKKESNDIETERRNKKNKVTISFGSVGSVGSMF